MIALYTLFVILNFIIFLNFKKISNKVGIYDEPNSNKLHKKKVSLTGGILVCLSIFLYLIFSNVFDTNLLSQLFSNRINILLFFLCCFFFFMMGLIDDYQILSSNFKLVLFIISILIYFWTDKSILIDSLVFSSINKKLHLMNFNFVFTFLCVIIFVNAFNFYDGSNGQIGLYSILVLFYLYYKTSDIEFIIISVPILFFLILNLKSETFIGNSGTYFLGFFLSIIIINVYKSSNFDLKADEIVLIMFYPVFDSLRLFIERLMKKKNPLIGDRNHIHHYLLNKFHLNYKVQLFLTTLVLLPILIYEIFDINLIIILLVNLVIYFIIIKLKNSSFV